MSQKTKKFNVIDIIICLVIVAAVCVCVLISGTKPEQSEPETKLATLELTEKDIGFSKNVTAGDKVTEKVSKKQIGTVVGVQAKPCKKQSFNHETGEGIIVEIPEHENVYVTMEIDEGAEVAVGKMLSVITKHFSGAGYVTGIQQN